MLPFRNRDPGTKRNRLPMPLSQLVDVDDSLIVTEGTNNQVLID